MVCNASLWRPVDEDPVNLRTSIVPSGQGPRDIGLEDSVVEERSMGDQLERSGWSWNRTNCVDWLLRSCTSPCSMGKNNQEITVHPFPFAKLATSVRTHILRNS